MHVAPGVPSPSFSGIQIFLENLRRPRENGLRFLKRRMVGKNSPQKSTPRKAAKSAGDETPPPPPSPLPPPGKEEKKKNEGGGGGKGQGPWQLAGERTPRVFLSSGSSPRRLLRFEDHLVAVLWKLREENDGRHPQGGGGRVVFFGCCF